MICMICMICMIIPTTVYDIDLPGKSDVFPILYDLPHIAGSKHFVLPIVPFYAQISFFLLVSVLARHTKLFR